VGARDLRRLVETRRVWRADIDPAGDGAGEIADGDGGFVRIRDAPRELDAVGEFQQVRQHTGDEKLL
jgi:hypothetical protein